MIDILGVINARIDDLEKAIEDTQQRMEKEPTYSPDPLAYGIVQGRLAELSYIRALMKGDNK